MKIKETVYSEICLVCMTTNAAKQLLQKQGFVLSSSFTKSAENVQWYDAKIYLLALGIENISIRGNNKLDSF